MINRHKNNDLPLSGFVTERKWPIGKRNLFSNRFLFCQKRLFAVMPSYVTDFTLFSSTPVKRV